MNITITFRNMVTSEATKRYARGKIAKLQKFLRQPMTARVTLSLDKLGSHKLRHIVEARLASGGRRVEAKEDSDDMYASIDKVIGKLERQIRGAKGAAQAKARRSGATLRGGTNPTPLPAPLPEAGRGRATKKKTKPTKTKAAAGKATAKAKVRRTPAGDRKSR
jgi:putative sigma-54 modulation protein